ncbi:hypothetical protein Clacol_008635 [Clathrus columnatus]|uniref:Uncharacterized protein n=1 Tax=Clathrus columnatus TaxID=1419009 RepID=A0AAV5AI96_9AGAM|nr:hypothetical protein Clacol_008635 [Clathrus columnatus]
MTVALFAILCGASVKIFKIYRPQIWFGWCIQIIGAGLLTSIQYNNAKTVGYCVIFGAGAGMNYAAQYYPIQSSLPVETNAQALAFHGFLRSFAAIWAVTLGGTILQTKLIQTLPSEVVSEVGTSAGLLYSIIPRIRTFPDSLRSVLQQAFLDSLRPIWIWITVLSVVGFLSSLVMEDVPMHIHTDKKWNPNAVHDHDHESGVFNRYAGERVHLMINSNLPALSNK